MASGSWFFGAPPPRSFIVAAFASLCGAAACHQTARKAVTKQDFASVNDYVLKKLNNPATTAEARKTYIVGQLGGPHRTEGGTSYWYTPVAECFYFQMSGEGWSSWGIGTNADCQKWAVTP